MSQVMSTNVYSRLLAVEFNFVNFVNDSITFGFVDFRRKIARLYLPLR